MVKRKKVTRAMKIEKSKGKLTFEEWMKEVDKHIGRACGMSHNDIDDFRYRDCYDDECRPGEVAEEALANAGFPI